MSELRDAIAGVVYVNTTRAADYYEEAKESADAVLAMPEMQAIRWALGMLHKHGGAGYLEMGLDLPASVVAWVLEGEQ